MGGLILAIQFFTRIPIKMEVPFTEKNIGASIFFLPLIGLIIGGVSVIPFILLDDSSKLMGSLFTIILTIFFTGGIHLDGLSDTFDGFLSGRKKERIMEIMKDSTLGAFGAISLVVIILSKFISIYELPGVLWIALPLSMGNGRIAAGYAISTKRNARNDGLGALFNKSGAARYFIYSAVIYSALVVILSPLYLLPLAGSIVVSEVVSRWAYIKIDGLTGDVYGGIIELSELASLIIFWGVTLWT